MKTTFFHDFLQIIYPHICLGCGNSLHQVNERICFSCIEGLPYTNESMFNNALNEKLMALSGISGSYALCYYNQDGLLQELMKELKYRNQPELGVILGTILGERLKEQVLEIDVIIPIPLHTRKLKKRTYNQATEIAVGVQSELGSTIDKGLVKRISNTKSQTNRTKLGRFENVEEIFSVVNKRAIMGQRILVVDDVMTTGATMLSCADLLLSHGATEVFIAAIGKADTIV